MTSSIWAKVSKCLQLFPVQAIHIVDNKCEIEVLDVNNVEMVKVMIPTDLLPLSEQKKFVPKDSSRMIEIPPMTQAVKWETKQWKKYVEDALDEGVQFDGLHFSKPLLFEWNQKACALEVTHVLIGQSKEVLTLKYDILNSEGQTSASVSYFLAPLVDEIVPL